ncbi:hypothetical protein D5R81_13965 [Parashewanella spongiae]|uniref:Uncharacterized protein n=1 Tax=Parashewanella spongiae TaxID=342950 RepID=A0A3A6U3Y6_9GAMM|nr:hypothetical protein [Parashewanella spongiae]MCL1079155.1 hypothetical protein [Parashewanella spongiae]RJY10759.1 hypothetical protein D5R81_13965 [Parashewanella spongiae]
MEKTTNIDDNEFDALENVIYYLRQIRALSALIAEKSKFEFKNWEADDYLSFCSHLSEAFEQGSEVLNASPHKHLSFLKRVADTGHHLARQKYLDNVLLGHANFEVYLPVEAERLLLLMAREQYNNPICHCHDFSPEVIELLELINDYEQQKNSISQSPAQFEEKRQKVSEKFLRNSSTMVKLLAPFIYVAPIFGPLNPEAALKAIQQIKSSSILTPYTTDISDYLQARVKLSSDDSQHVNDGVLQLGVLAQKGMISAIHSLSLHYLFALDQENCIKLLLFVVTTQDFNAIKMSPSLCCTLAHSYYRFCRELTQKSISMIAEKQNAGWKSIDEETEDKKPDIPSVTLLTIEYLQASEEEGTCKYFLLRGHDILNAIHLNISTRPKKAGEENDDLTSQMLKYLNDAHHSMTPTIQILKLIVETDKNKLKLADQIIQQSMELDPLNCGFILVFAEFYTSIWTKSKIANLVVQALVHADIKRDLFCIDVPSIKGTIDTLTELSLLLSYPNPQEAIFTLSKLKIMFDRHARLKTKIYLMNGVHPDLVKLYSQYLKIKNKSEAPSCPATIKYPSKTSSTLKNSADIASASSERESCSQVIESALITKDVEAEQAQQKIQEEKNKEAKSIIDEFNEFYHFSLSAQHLLSISKITKDRMSIFSKPTREAKEESEKIEQIESEIIKVESFYQHAFLESPQLICDKLSLWRQLTQFEKWPLPRKKTLLLLEYIPKLDVSLENIKFLLHSLQGSDVALFYNSMLNAAAVQISAVQIGLYPATELQDNETKILTKILPSNFFVSSHNVESFEMYTIQCGPKWEKNIFSILERLSNMDSLIHILKHSRAITEQANIPLFERLTSKIKTFDQDTLKALWQSPNINDELRVAVFNGMKTSSNKAKIETLMSHPNLTSAQKAACFSRLNSKDKGLLLFHASDEAIVILENELCFLKAVPDTSVEITSASNEIRKYMPSCQQRTFYEDLQFILSIENDSTTKAHPLRTKLILQAIEKARRFICHLQKKWDISKRTHKDYMLLAQTKTFLVLYEEH